MSVYVKGMEMPKSCYYCPFTVLKNGRRAYCPFCHAEYSNPSNEPDGRLANCPLIPVPPHGDLIDRDETVKTLAHDYAYVAADMVRDEMPTIIPAEE